MEDPNKKPDEQVVDTTTVVEADVNIDELFGNPGAESIMLPSDGEEKKNLFTQEKKC